MNTILFQLEDLTSPSCINKIEGVLSMEEGVESAKVMFNSSKVKVGYKEDKTDPGRLADLIEKVGYPIISRKLSE